MPIGEYYKGNGSEVMASMKKKYGGRAKNVFYATANAKGMKPTSHMPKEATQSPKGDIGDHRVAECNAQRGFMNRGGKDSGAEEFGSNVGMPGKIGEKD